MRPFPFSYVLSLISYSNYLCFSIQCVQGSGFTPNDGAPDPMETVLAEGGPYHARGKLKDYIKYLKKAGREYAVEELKRRHTGEL